MPNTLEVVGTNVAMAGRGHPRSGPAAWRAGELGLLGLLALVASACGGGGSPPVVRPPASTGGPTTSAPVTTSVPTSSTSSSVAPGGPRITVTPRSHLAASAVVEVTGSGFSPNQALVVNECAAKGSATGPGDCNLVGLAAVTSDASGEVRLAFRVVKGPFGANRITCGPAQRCLVSVSEASPTPSEEADVEITFG